VQYGVFSPIMRLHSTSNEFMGKEPWKYRADVEYFATKALRFRHRLIPYIYTANRLTAKEGIPLVRPMYYLYPEDERSYQAPNQYYFGSELIVCPITQKTDPQTGLAGVKVFLPEGRYTDIFNGRIYSGNREAYLYRDEAGIPVLAREGAIIPLGVKDTKNDSGNPTDLELLIYRGTNTYTLYEDDGYSNDYLNGAFAETVFSVTEKENALCFTAEKAQGDLSVLPQKRNYLFTFRDITNAESIQVTVNDAAADFNMATEEGCLQLSVETVLPSDRIDITLTGITTAKNDSIRELKTELISKLQGSNNAKNRFNRVLDDDASSTAFSALKGPLSELTALYFET
jgi:alpha-glucosidase (family GH31 glycosyl hydrolase)